MSLLVRSLFVTYNTKRPSGDQLTGHLPSLPSRTCVRWLAPDDGASNSARRSRANEFSSTRAPSGDQISQFSSDGSDVNCVRSPEPMLYIQMSRVARAPSVTATATRVPSGEISRLPWSAIGPTAPSRWPLRSNQIRRERTEGREDCANTQGAAAAATSRPRSARRMGDHSSGLGIRGSGFGMPCDGVDDDIGEL